MASELEDVLHRLTLAGAKEEIIIVDNIGSDEKDDQIALCLYGKLLTEKSFDPRAMKTVFRNIWRPGKGVVIRDLDTNLFAFQFFPMADKSMVLNAGPWSFNGRLLLLREATGLEQQSEVKFDTAHFWVKACDLPAKRQTTTFAEILGNKIGRFVGCVPSATYDVDKFLCFQVEVDVTKPLMRGIRIMMAQKPVWITRRYVKLPDFVMDAECLATSTKFCGYFDPHIDENSLQYDEWLRASPLKAKLKSAEAEIREERRLYLAYQGSKLLGTKAKTKLVFDAPSMPPDSFQAQE